MTIQNQEKFLNHIAKKLGRRRKEVVEKPLWSVQPQKRLLKDKSSDELIGILKKQCKKIHTDFERTDLESLPRILNIVIEKYNAENIILPTDTRNKKYGIDKYLMHLKKQDKQVHFWDESKGKQNQKFAEKADVGIVYSDITLADSGTVTLFHNRYHGRSISLLPKAVIAIISRSTLVSHITKATEEIHQSVEKGSDVSSAISFVTGPSNSADIEMNLIVGVHGPVYATYIVVN